MRKYVSILSLALAATIVAAGFTLAQDAKDKKSDYEISDVMKKGMKGGLKDKVMKGGADAAEKLEFLDMMISLKAYKPKKGDADSWKALTDATLMAAAKAAVGRDDAAADLKAATNCAKCHKEHKPPTEE